MSSAKELRAALGTAPGAAALRQLYGENPAVIDDQKARYAALVDRYSSLFPEDRDLRFFSTPGRTEVGGNHTDHNAGRVLAAAVNLDALAVAAPSSDGCIIVESDGYPRQEIRVDDLERRETEAGTPQALTRGVAARIKERGYEVGGFHACVTSTVLEGSGLSSSASYEVLIATIINRLYNAGRISDLHVAMISQYAENNYFGKPCGLMDQTTCAVGGFVTIDFKDFANPLVRKVPFDFSASGFSLVIVEHRRQPRGPHRGLCSD